LKKSSLLLKIQKQNTQTLQVGTMNIKTESITKSYLKYQAARLGLRDIVVEFKEGGRASTLS
jgi:hypothetical protein